MGRVYPDEKGHLIFKEGDYGCDAYERWFVRPPSCHAGGIPDHDVREHEDGTITVTPSIVLHGEDGGIVWHGYLIKGEWRGLTGETGPSGAVNGAIKKGGLYE